MTTLAYDIGDRPVITGTFTDVEGAPADPSAITFELIAPDGTVSTGDEGAAVNSAVGTWSWTIPAAFDQHGTWVARVAGTAGVIAAAESKIRVRNSAFD